MHSCGSRCPIATLGVSMTSGCYQCCRWVEMTDRDLNDMFRGIKNVIDVRVAIDRRTGQPRGFAHADFLDVKSAMEGMKILEKKEAYGRRLRLDYSFGPSTAPRNTPQ